MPSMLKLGAALWNTPNIGSWYSVTVANGVVYAVDSNYGFGVALYALDAMTGAVLAKLATSPLAPPVVVNGMVYVVDGSRTPLRRQYGECYQFSAMSSVWEIPIMGHIVKVVVNTVTYFSVFFTCQYPRAGRRFFKSLKTISMQEPKGGVRNRSKCAILKT